MTEKLFVRGDMLKSITTLDKFKRIMNDLIRGYPAYLNWGIFETYFGKNTSAVIKFLEEDGIIRTFQPKKEGDPLMYRVTSQGIIFATAMAQLEYAQKTHFFTKVLIWFTSILVLLTFGLFIFGFFQSVIPLWF